MCILGRPQEEAGVSFTPAEREVPAQPQISCSVRLMISSWWSRSRSTK